MREFNLSEALKGWPICTRDGRKAEISAQYDNGLLLVKIEGMKRYSWHFPDGTWRLLCNPSRRDLFLCDEDNQPTARKEANNEN